MDKASLRKKLKSMRNNMPLPEIGKQSSLILEHFKSTFYPLLPEKGSIIAYLSTRSEVRTGGIIKFLHVQQRKIYVPCVENDKICPLHLPRKCRMTKGKFNIYEPANRERIRSFGNITAVIVPGIAFDMKGNRLGFGGGYFDRFLAELPVRAIKAGLAFSSQIIKSVPSSLHDVKMDYIITEKGVYKI